MVARLLARLIQAPVRRAHAGSQEGKDALTDDGGVAIECKRYGEETRLNARLLISELEEARQRHPDLQLWILVTTTALDPTDKEKLDRAGYGKGLAVLYLDTAATGPYLDPVAGMTALCATDVETTLEFFSAFGEEVRHNARRELERIRSLPDFAAWTNWLVEEIRNRLPIWRFIVERQNLALAKQIRETPWTAFGTDYKPAQAVPRKARSQLDQWFHEALRAQGPNPPPVAVVLGERYDGKTWLVYQWLLEIAALSEVPIFFMGSGRGLQSSRRLTKMQSEDLAEVVPRASADIEAFVRHFRGRNVAKTPWAVVVLDGLNEYAPSHAVWQRHLEAALGRGEIDCRPAALIVTVREHAWKELKELLPGAEPLRLDGETDPAGRPNCLEFVEVPLGPFDDEELRDALALLKLPADFLESLPPSARSLARRPRYLGLLVAHRLRLKDYAAVTAEVLHWLDLCDKVGQREGMVDWGPSQYQAFLRDLAQQWLDQKFLGEAEVRRLLKDLTAEVPRVLADLRSQGALCGDLGNYTVEPSRLTMGYALFLRDALIKSSRQKEDLKETLDSCLAPQPDGDEAVDALRAASTLMLVEVAAAGGREGGSSVESLEVLDTVLEKWLGSRNLSKQDLEAIYELRRLLFEPLFRNWRSIWHTAKRRNRLREIVFMVFGEAVQANGEEKSRLRQAVREWFRFVPLEGSWLQRARAKTERKTDTANVAAKAAVAPRLRHRVALPCLGHLGLQIVEGLDVLDLQSLGLYLVSRAPDLVGPDDLLAFVIVRIVLEERIGSGDLWAVRRALEAAPSSWFEQEISRPTAEPNDPLAKALRMLVQIAGRADLQPVGERLRQGLEEEEQASDLLGDPALAPLPEAEQIAFAQTLEHQLSEEGRAGGRKMLSDLDDLCPAMAARAPDLGAKVIVQALQDISRDIQEGRQLSLLELRGHAALAGGEARKDLRRALRLSRRRNERQWVEQREITLALLPSATAVETMALLVDQKERWQHKQTLALAGFLSTVADRKVLVEALQATQDPHRKSLLRSLLAAAGGSPCLPVREIAAIRRTLRAGKALEVTSALALAVQQRIESIDLKLLLPIASGEVAAWSDAKEQDRTQAADHASRLMIRNYPHEQIKDHLDDSWRAISAARRPEDARDFLDEISTDLKHYEAQRAGIFPHWQGHDLPSELMIHLDARRVAEWTRAFTAWDGSGWRWLGGLIRPTFDWCLRNAAGQARVLWPQVYPFQRRRFGGGSRLYSHGLDWVLVALNQPESDDGLARGFLADLILDARTDLELLEIALGARCQDKQRLHGLARDLSADPRAEARARAAAILGWLGEGQEQLEALRSQDPSVWVREQAEIALSRQSLEAWAESWFEKFLRAEGVADRWAAGRLFLECADRRVDAWDWERILGENLGRRLKGEALLLLWAAQDRAAARSDQLKETFLGYRVSELSALAYPWRLDDEWILDRYGRRS
ncbi:MAG TPA: hypothetical protein VH988_16575 [Thermoanaerobaculia bacterium]|nr:hypothetical protein [Thermoanaerobaculia bacterium]